MLYLPPQCEAIVLSYCPLMPFLLQWQVVCKRWRRMIHELRIEEFRYTCGRRQPVHFSGKLKAKLSRKLKNVVEKWTNFRHIDLTSAPDGVVSLKLLETMSQSLSAIETLSIDKYVRVFSTFVMKITI